jgi:hypothetical protein
MGASAARKANRATDTAKLPQKRAGTCEKPHYLPAVSLSPTWEREDGHEGIASHRDELMRLYDV